MLFVKLDAVPRGLGQVGFEIAANLSAFRNNPDSMDESGDKAQQGQKNVQPESAAKSNLQKYPDRRHENRSKNSQ